MGGGIDVSTTFSLGFGGLDEGTGKLGMAKGRESCAGLLMLLVKYDRGNSRSALVDAAGAAFCLKLEKKLLRAGVGALDLKSEIRGLDPSPCVLPSPPFA